MTRPTVSDLVAHFQLQRRATGEAFTGGVRLARLGAVFLTQVEDYEVLGEVRDSSTEQVWLLSRDGAIVGECSCSPGAGAGAGAVCAHQVAVAHALWVRDRQYARGSDGCSP